MTRPTYITGLPGDLPPGEHILWQGAPAWRSLARRLCHIRAVALYFALVITGTVVVLAANGTPPATIALAALPLVAGGLFVVGLLVALAWWIARSTEYTVTTHRLVLRIGLALPATLAIPYRAIARAGIRLHPDGTGNVPVETKPGFTVPLHRVWPHARAWRLRRAHPTLLCIPDAGAVATLLARALANAESDRLRQAQPVPSPVTQPELMAAE